MSFTNWKFYFQANQDHLDSINWSASDSLTSDQKALITKSIRQFQKGENSEGKNLIHYAKEYGDITYLETIKLFIREEQRHALVLGKFMGLHDIEKIKSHWVDDTFRKIRKLGSLENSVMVLLTAEIIAAIYYQALYEATDSQILKNICKQILIDEEMHINFQSYTLSKFHSKKSKLLKTLSRTVHKLLMTGTICIVWLYHRNVLKQGKFTAFSFFSHVFAEFNRSDRMIRGLETINDSIKHRRSA